MVSTHLSIYVLNYAYWSVTAEPTLHLWDESTWSWFMIFSVSSWVSFVRVSLSIFATVFFGETGICWCSSCCVFPWFWCQAIAITAETRWRSSLSTHGNMWGDWISFSLSAWLAAVIHVVQGISLLGEFLLLLQSWLLHVCWNCLYFVVLILVGNMCLGIYYFPLKISFWWNISFQSTF